MNAAMGKLVLAVILDVVDFTVGRIPGLEIIVDVMLGVAAVLMWGWPGLFAFWEVADPTGQADGFVPTMTIIALTQMRKKPETKAMPASEDAERALRAFRR